MNITRTFHSVGQGAFYSETFEDAAIKRFVVVYDCGSYSIGAKSLDSKRNGKLKKKIHSDLGKSDFNPGSAQIDVDILFISHFDTDHINGCQFLNPKIVFIPYLSDEQINILSAINTAIDGNLQVEILRNPQNYFRDARIIRIRPVDEGHINQDGLIIDLSDENLREHFKTMGGLDSCQPVKLIYPSKELWEYVPYNPDWNMFFEAFKKAVEEDEELDYNQLNKVDNGAYVTSNIERLRRAYDKLGNKNKHSLVVYSGPIRRTDVVDTFTSRIEYYCRDYGYCKCHYGWHIMRGDACVYYGDITVAPSWHDKYSDFLETTARTQHIGTIQIPHHGAWSSRGDLSITKNMRDVFCIVSVGEKNSYGHPSSRILSSILSKRCYPTMVTENAQSVFIEIFELTP